MSTARIQTNPTLIPAVMQLPPMHQKDFFLVDVGASGGIGQHWQVFQDHLRAVGFDPLVNEVKRLNDCNPNPKIKYEEAYVVCRRLEEKRLQDQGAPKLASKNNQSIFRSSSRAALLSSSENYVKEHYNSGQEIVFSGKRVQLDDFFSPDSYAQLDFLKVDTDGNDLAVLLGAEAIFKAGGVLGISVEVQFHGNLGDNSNVFANIDAYLRNRGFSLFDLYVYRYSRADLPSPFAWDIPAQTLEGQIMWGEALYFRDLCLPNYEEMWAFKPDEAQILKLACLFELFCLNDCAAKIINKYSPRVPAFSETDRLLDLLTPKWIGKTVTYKEYMSAFNANPKSFYRSAVSAALAAETAPSLEQPVIAPIPPEATSLPSVTQPESLPSLTVESKPPETPRDPTEFHSSGRPRSKPSSWSVRGIRQRLNSIFGS
ncbi:MAG: FkbM family methyltransferase [Planctomycetes bacterium]|nr:FkbM family methyltransferase [Planctomycetota bacterium]